MNWKKPGPFALAPGAVVIVLLVGSTYTYLKLAHGQPGPQQTNASISESSLNNNTAPLGPTVTTTPLTLKPTPTTTRPTFRQLDLSPIANWPFDHLIRPPVGQVSYSGIPFTILSGSKAVFQTQHHLLVNLPTEGRIDGRTAAPTTVYILLIGGYVDPEFRDKKVGEANLAFDNGSTLSVPLLAWRNIRETWAYEGDPKANPLEGSPPPARWQNVVAESQARAGRAAKGFVDMTTIPIPTPYSYSNLVTISVRDTSVSSVGSQDPSLIVMGITVESSGQGNP